ncbi:MAG: nucleotidyltransferase domain-containing protein [Stappiaceae bacterium]
MQNISFTPALSAVMRQTIEDEVAKIEQEEDVSVLFAIESGSRAWGFPSPDSDYDVRFVYVRPLDWYLSITPGRDVIEKPITGELDISGWDLQKALGLLIKPNPVLLEWLSSPIRYRWDDGICALLTAFAKKTTHHASCLYHYLHLGEGQWGRHFANADAVPLKKYFYVLRPALAIRWLRLHPDVLPPMNLQALANGTDLDGATQEALNRLIELKAQTRECGNGQRFELLDQLIDGEFQWASATDKTKDSRPLLEEANVLFRKIVREREGL